MKKVKRIVACAVSALIVGTTLSFSGCRYSRIKTEDDVYSALMDTTKELFEREGELTIKMTVTQEKSSKSEPEEAKIVYSVLPEEGKMFFTLQSKDEEMTMKLFEGGGKPLVFIRTKVKELTTSGGVVIGSMMVETENYKVASSTAVEQLTSLFSFSTYANFDLEQFYNDYAYSFSEIKSAYESVYAEQLAEKKKTDKNADAKFEMSAKKSVNELSYEFSSKIKTSGTKSGVYGYYTIGYQEKIVEKKGKISEIFLADDVSHIAQTSNEKRYEKTSIHLGFDYSFDENGYNAIQTDVPKDETVPSLQFISQNMQMLFHVNGCVTKKTTVAHTFDADFIFRDLSKDYNKTGFSIEWFKDEAYANPFIPNNLSYGQFCDIKNIYGKMTIHDGYAVIARDYTIRDNRSDAYKAVFGPISESSQGTSLEVKYLEETPTFTLPQVSDDYQAFIDGKAYDGTNNVITLENGKFYRLEMAKVVTNEQYSIFDVDASTLSA